MDYNLIRQLFALSKRVVVTSHKSPDGDAMGSALAMAAVLKKQGHLVTVVVPDRFPAFLAWMQGAGEVLIFEECPRDGEKIMHEAEVIFALDYNHLDRVGDMGKAIAATSATKVMIDHHISPSAEFVHILSDTGASSTAELVMRFFTEIGWSNYIGTAEAECLYTGIMTDTGSFRFPSTSAITHRTVAQLIDNCGLQPAKVHQAIFDTNTFARLQLIGHALSKKMEYLPALHTTIISISLAEKNRFSYQKGDTEGLVNYGLSIAGANLAVFLSEEYGFVKFSLRSKGDLDVNELARQHFNGGGHKNAAGGRLEGNLDNALAKLKNVLQEKFA